MGNRLGLRIKECREYAKMTQAKLAELTGYKNKTIICKIEQGLTIPPYEKIELFAEVLNTTPTFLLGWDQERQLDLSSALADVAIVTKYSQLSPANKVVASKVIDALLHDQI